MGAISLTEMPLALTRTVGQPGRVSTSLCKGELGKVVHTLMKNSAAPRFLRTSPQYADFQFELLCVDLSRQQELDIGKSMAQGR
jgi:hypothetical protein